MFALFGDCKQARLASKLGVLIRTAKEHEKYQALPHYCIALSSLLKENAYSDEAEFWLDKAAQISLKCSASAWRITSSRETLVPVLGSKMGFLSISDISDVTTSNPPFYVGALLDNSPRDDKRSEIVAKHLVVDSSAQEVQQEVPDIIATPPHAREHLEQSILPW